MVHLMFNKIQIGLTLKVPAYPGCPGKQVIKWVSISKFEIPYATAIFYMTKSSKHQIITKAVLQCTGNMLD